MINAFHDCLSYLPFTALVCMYHFMPYSRSGFDHVHHLKLMFIELT